MARKYDVAIIGSGPAGYIAAIRLRQLNRSVCVIDISEGRLGGVCLNEGCLPVKSLVNSARVFSTIKKAEDYGIDAEVKSADMKKITALSQEAASKLRSGLKSLFKKYGIEFIVGKAKLIAANKLGVASNAGKEEIEADKIIIATGSSAIIPSDIIVDGERIIQASEVMRLAKVPKTLLVIGAGAVGVEFCSLFSSLETKVTLAEMLPNILPFEEEEISNALERIFKKRGIEVLTNTKVKGLKRKKDSVGAILEVAGKEKKAEFELALIAIGRRPNTEGIGLEEIGVKLQDGFIAADAKMRTNIEGIYAAGDVLNTPMYAHVAYKEGIIAAEEIAGINPEPVDYENVPSVIFSEPQVASVGLTESEAKEKGYEIAVSKQFFRANGLAIATRREEGFIKIIADKKTKKILGVHIIGGEATEILHEFVLAKSSNLKIDDIAKAVHAHPTFSEIAVDAAKAVFDKPIH